MSQFCIFVIFAEFPGIFVDGGKRQYPRSKKMTRRNLGDSSIPNFCESLCVSRAAILCHTLLETFLQKAVQLLFIGKTIVTQISPVLLQYLLKWKTDYDMIRPEEGTQCSSCEISINASPRRDRAMHE